MRTWLSLPPGAVALGLALATSGVARGAHAQGAPPAPPAPSVPAPADTAPAAPRDTMVVSVAAESPIPEETIVPDRIRGFLARKETKRDGYFFEEPAIRAANSQRLSEVIRKIPGVRLIGSNAAGSAVRLRNCRPLVWLDGIQQLGSELDEIGINDVAAMEVYVSPAAVPAQYRDHRVGCGAILLWSRS